MLVSTDEEMAHTHSGVRGPVQGVRVDVIANSFIALQVSLEPPHIKPLEMEKSVYFEVH